MNKPSFSLSFNIPAQPQLLFHTDYGGLCVNISQLHVEDNEEKTKGCSWRYWRMDFQMKQRDDIMAKSASRNTEGP